MPQTLQSEENATSDLHTVTEMDTTSKVLPVPAKVEAISRNVEEMTIEEDLQLNDVRMYKNNFTPYYVCSFTYVCVCI